MKNFLQIFLAITIIGCSNSEKSKSNLESEKIYEFVNWLSSKENLINDTLVFLQADVTTTWRSKYLSEIATVDDLKESRSLSNKSLNSFLRPEDLEKIFAESNIAFRFDSGLLSNPIQLLNKEEIEKIKLDPLDFQTNGEIEFAGKYQGFEILSKPIFFQDYRYCFIYIETVSWDLSSGGSGIAFYENKNGKWEKVAVIPLNMAG